MCWSGAQKRIVLGIITKRSIALHLAQVIRMAMDPSQAEVPREYPERGTKAETRPISTLAALALGFAAVVAAAITWTALSKRRRP